MYRLIASIVSLMALSGSALRAQDVTGTWQGTLVAGRELRTVIKVSKTPEGSLGATLYSIDQQAPPIQVSSVMLQGNALKLNIATMGATYEGKLSGDGSTITGSMTMGPGEAGGQLDIQGQRGVEESLAALAGRCTPGRTGCRQWENLPRLTPRWGRVPDFGPRYSMKTARCQIPPLPACGARASAPSIRAGA